MPFHKTQEFGKPAKKLSGGPAPDIEDAFDVSSLIHSKTLSHE